MMEVQDSINNRIDCAVEDGGVGGYEYGDVQYTDVHPYLALTTDEVVIEYEDSNEAIETTIRGIYEDGESGMDLVWVAELIEVKWNGKKKLYLATYILQQV